MPNRYPWKYNPISSHDEYDVSNEYDATCRFSNWIDRNIDGICVVYTVNWVVEKKRSEFEFFLPYQLDHHRNVYLHYCCNHWSYELNFLGIFSEEIYWWTDEYPHRMNWDHWFDEWSMVLEQLYSMNNSVLVRYCHRIDEYVPMEDFRSMSIHYWLLLSRDLIHPNQSCEFFSHVEQHYFDDELDNHINNIEILSIDDQWTKTSDEQSEKEGFCVSITEEDLPHVSMQHIDDDWLEKMNRVVVESTMMMMRHSMAQGDHLNWMKILPWLQLVLIDRKERWSSIRNTWFTFNRFLFQYRDKTSCVRIISRIFMN